jgi:hypothetical protein
LFPISVQDPIPFQDEILDSDGASRRSTPETETRSKKRVPPTGCQPVSMGRKRSLPDLLAPVGGGRNSRTRTKPFRSPIHVGFFCDAYSSVATLAIPGGCFRRPRRGLVVRPGKNVVPAFGPVPNPRREKAGKRGKFTSLLKIFVR